MKLGQWFILVLSVLLWLQPHGAAAEDNPAGEKENTNLEEMVVTATKTPKPRGNVTQKVDVVTSGEIEDQVTAYGNLADTVSHLPGAYVHVLARNQPNWGSVGGLGTNYNTYMLDGLPMDSFSDPMSIDPWIVERVEVQRGPASVLYPNFLSQDFSGNQSPLGGTTNFILRERVDQPGTRIATKYGRFNTAKGRIDHRNRFGNFHFYVGGILEYSDYTNYRYKVSEKPSGMDMTEDPDYFNKTFDFRGAYFFNDSDRHKVSFYIHRQWHDGDMGRPNRELDHNYLTLQAKYQVPVRDWGDVRVQLGYMNYDRNFGEDNYPPSLTARGVSGVDQVIIPGDVSLAVRHLGGGLLTVGGDFQLADYKWFNGASSDDRINDATAQQFGLYVQEEFEIKRWILRAGGRFNYTRHHYELLGGYEPEEDNQSWESLVWSVGARYKITDNFSLYANSGTSFLVPAAKFIGGTIRASDEGKAGYGGTLPNLDLKAEKGWGSDLGFDWQATPTWKFGVRGFYNVVDDAVVSETVHANVNQSHQINAGKCVSYGVEATVENELTKYLNWFGNYTYTYTRVYNDVDPRMDGVSMSVYPEHMGNVGLFLKLPWDLKVSTWLKLVGPTYSSTNKYTRTELHGYQVLSAKLEKMLFQKNRFRVDGTVELYNITNNRFRCTYNYQDAGFTPYVGVQVSF